MSLVSLVEILVRPIYGGPLRCLPFRVVVVSFSLWTRIKYSTRREGVHYPKIFFIQPTSFVMWSALSLLYRVTMTSIDRKPEDM